MHNENGSLYKFKSFRLDLAERQLLDNNRPVPLTPKAFDVLAFLVEHSGHLVEKEEVMEAVWPDSFVEEANLSRIVWTIRKALREDENGLKFIETVPTKGYRFVADVTEVNGDTSASVPSFAGEIEPGRRREIGNGLEKDRKDEFLKPSIKQRAFPRFAVVTGAIFLVVVSAAGFSFFEGYWPARTRVTRSTPETFSGEALQDYQQGRFFVERRHDGDYEQALEFFEKAIDLDPNYANAYAAKADVKSVLFWRSSSHEDISQARTAARKAIELDPSNSYAHSVLCRILTTYDWDHKEAAKECRAAVEFDPNDHEAQKEYAFLLRSLGRESEALAAMDKAIAIAPTSFNKRSRGMILYEFERYDEAIAQLEQVGETDPLYKESSKWLLRAYEMKKDYLRALESYRNMLRQSGTKAEDIAATKAAFVRDGWPGVLRKMADSPNMGNLFRAGTYAQLGEKDNAFVTLDEMFRRRTVLLVTVAQEPTLKPLRDDPRFEDLLKRIGLK